ncbi:uncharacterized protein TNCT_731461 [Trichonephila clavata]|uniref:Uncharacterized protein n=1 Tax=Trichonephila clavata TaxID=2740835 RepID=A0A8X6H4B9_TRICU|nr:uncharacterized protein TNCT_731461 [Trichonephila clavata]
MANALQKQTDLSVPEQAKLDVVLKLQDKFELLKNDYYGIANDTEYAKAEPSLNSLEDDLQDFETQFCDLVIENSQLSDSEKLHYLRGALRGDAEIVETSADDFNSLFKALEQRYENKRVIVDCHIKNILNVQAMKYESSGDLRILLDNIKKD